MTRCFYCYHGAEYHTDSGYCTNCSCPCYVPDYDEEEEST